MEQYQSKKEAILGFLDKGMTMLHVDARVEDTLVPESLLQQADLRLNLSYRFPSARIEVSDEAVEATLTFAGEPFRCHIPFAAIYALTSHQSQLGLVFPESLPEELYQQLETEINAPVHLQEVLPADDTHSTAPKLSVVETTPGRKTHVPHLRVIEGEKPR